MALIMVMSPFVAMAMYEPGPEIWPSQEGYVEGQQVVIYGANWEPLVSVEISLEHPDFPEVISYSVMAESDGSFTFSDYVASGVLQCEIPVLVTATQTLADGPVLQATTEFFDPAVFFMGYTLKPTAKWTTGVLKGYNEGDSVPYKVILAKKFFPEGVAIVQMAHNTLTGADDDIHGVDYVTEYPGTSPPFNNYDPTDEPFSVIDGDGVITDQRKVYDGTDKFDDRFGVYLLVWEFTLDFGDLDAVEVGWGAHLAVTDLSEDRYGASYWPGASLHSEIFWMDPEPDSGDRDVPIDISKALVPPQMTLDKCCSPGTVGIGEEITFTLEWANLGEADAVPLTITDTLPMVIDLDETSFLFWTSENLLKVYPASISVVGNTFVLSFSSWRGTGLDGADEPLVGYLEFSGTVLACAPGEYVNYAVLSYSDDHGGYYAPVEASCPFMVVGEPEVEVVKTGPTHAHVGDTVTYTYVITNTGPVDVTLDAVDDVAGLVTSGFVLPAGESETFTVDYIILDGDGEWLTNTVTVTAESEYGGSAEATDDWTIDILRPEISVTKTGDKQCGEIGETITYTITVSNPAAETVLYNVVVDDPLLGSWPIATLTPGASDVLVGALIIDGKHNDPLVNTVTATGEDLLGRVVVDTASAEAVDILHPMVEVTKEADLTCAEEGETITYWINVTNPSWDTDLVRVVVWDYMIDADDPLFDGAIPFGETVELGPYYYIVPRGAEWVENVVYVDAWDEQEHHVSDTDTWTVEIFHPAIAIDKWSVWICAEEGETVEYFIKVWNPSHDATMDATVWDLLLSPDPIWSGQLGPGGEYTIGPREYVVPEDAEWVNNTAYVWAYDHQQHAVYAEDCWAIEVFHPAIAIYKWADLECAEEGETITYWIDVWNPSHDATMWAAVSDPLLSGDLLWSGYLGPGGITHLGPYPYIVPEDAEWVNNTAYVRAYDHQEHVRCAESTWSVEIFYPAIEIVKWAEDEMTCAHVDETITYWILVTNPSHDATMTVDVYDPMFSVDPLWSGSLAPGEDKLLGPYDYVVPEDAEWVDNTAYVWAYDHQEHERYAESSWSVEILRPAISVTKIGPTEASVGDTITYYVNVTNTGDTELFDVQVFDSIMGHIATVGSLGVGLTMYITYTYVVPAGEGLLVNTATAYAVDRQDVQVSDDATWNVFKLGVINGFKTADLSADGVWDDGEPGLYQWLISLYGDLADGGTFSATRLTDTNGYYEFTGLRAGTYTVSEVMQAGWVAMTPESYLVTVGSGSVLTRSFGNTPYGSICGYKWLDADMDGFWDLGESAIPGWTIYLSGEDAAGNSVDMTTVTDGTGRYCFADLLPGLYTVSEEIRLGWTAVTPTSVEIDVSALEPFEVCVDFGNVRFGSICGYKWLDEYMNGAWDYHEVGLPGWTIELTGVLADGSEFGPVYTVTDSTGAYCFEGLLPGTYIVREIIPEGWTHITPDRYEVTIDFDDRVFCAKFGNVQYGKIDGYKFLDWDMDGFFDGVEPGLEGWAITLEGWLNDGIPPMSYAGTYVGPFTVYTDANGYWCFDNLLPGVYRVTEESREGWFNTTPLSRVYIVGSGTYVFDQKFGNVPYTCFNGYKFEDVDGNGEWDQGEPGLPGWTIVVEGVRNDKVPVLIVLETDRDGYWATCYNILPGSYVIYEIHQEGWVASTQDLYGFTIPMCAEPMSYEFLFGNLKLGKICGYKYEDVNGNGVLDDGDVPLAGWEIRLSGAATATTVTDETGRYCFEGLMPGEYTVTEEERAGWVAMTPISYPVTVVSGSEVCVPVFLNVALSTVYGYKFEDINSNGVWDDGEPGIDGWTIYMVWDDDPTVFSTQTDESGYYEFSGLMPSDYYLVWEETRAHWVWTTPPYEEFSLVSGTSHRVHDFGNFRCVWIEVFKYEDVDSDGRYGCGDRPIEGWTFYLHDAAGLLVDEAVTGEDGYAGFWVCEAGTWTVVEETRDGVTPINPASGWLEVGTWSGARPQTLEFGNFWDVEIKVFKYEDVNSNGQYDEGVDVPLDGWLIILYAVGADFWYSELTDSDGMAYFVLNRSDQIIVSEDLPLNWCQITPGYPGYYEMTVYSGSVVEVLEFGNFRCVWIDVFKYEDVNSNGMFDCDDLPVEGWYFYLYDPDGNYCAWAMTDETGHAGFWVCEAGTWTVEEETRVGVTPINPASGWLQVEVWSGAQPETLEFGNFWDVLIVVFKYEDVNSNGVYDDGDVPLEGWMFEISGPGVTNVVEYTDEFGYAYFVVNRAGTYTVTEEDREGWTHVNPADGDLDVTVCSGSVPVTLMFGNFEDVIIIIFKFDDRYADGQYCPGEGDAPLEGWVFELYLLVDDVWVLVDSGETGADGYLEFVVTKAGVYKVVEVLQTGWFIIVPVGGSYTVEVESGDRLDTLVFANFKLGKIFGWKWNDLNGNGEWDEGEPGLPGWTISFHGWYYHNDALYELWGSIKTDGDGYYEFTGLPPGTYLVSESPPMGEDDWIPTSPSAVEVAVIGHTEARVDFLNFELGCVWGYKYEDMNGNGVLDGGDVPLAGWNIYLYLGDGLEATTMTDCDGWYMFCGLGPGEYTVLEESRAGWVATNANSETVTMTSGASIRIHDFLNFELGSIVGWKFEDLNSNGVWDDGEPAIRGWTIHMIRDDLPDVYTAHTDGDGRFEFSGLMADYYFVWEEDVEGWTHTNQPWALVDIFSGSHLELEPFGNFRDVCIELFKYEDVNGNGVFDNGDRPIEGWEFVVTGPCFDVPLVVHTDGDGEAMVCLTMAGTYTVTEEDRPGWMHVSPESGYVEVPVKSGDTFSPFRFGNFMLGEITGQKFYDWNLNGVKDDGELGLANWVIWVNGTLVGGGTLHFTRLTDSSGFYQVSGLPAGTYVVSERLEFAPAGWVPTRPVTVSVDITSGSAMTVNFGNAVFGVIEGYKFYDKDMDGVWDDGEPGLAGWTIVLEGVTDEGLPVYRTTLTDATGHYLFDDVQPGTYEVSEVLPETWSPTTPLPVAVDASGVMEYFEAWVYIGNVRFATVFGYKFLDTIPDCEPWWPNGIFDEDEHGLADWKITLEGWTATGDHVSLVQYTDELGYYEFTGLLPGTYWVNETMLEFWYASKPVANMIIIYPYPHGIVVIRIDFGNVLPQPDPEIPFLLDAGWNLWSMPIVVDGLTAKGLLEAIGPSGLMVTMLDEAEKRYYSFMPEDNVSEKDFPIESGVGYFVYVTSETYFTLTGYFPPVSKTDLDAGWNFIGYSALKPVPASDLLSRVNGLVITMFDEDNGRYVSYVAGDGAEYDFLVTPNKAYYIWVGGPCELVFG